MIHSRRDAALGHRSQSDAVYVMLVLVRVSAAVSCFYANPPCEQSVDCGSGEARQAYGSDDQEPEQCGV